MATQWEHPTYADGFCVGQVVLWPNGAEGSVRAIDLGDDTLMDECGAWHPAYDVDPMPSAFGGVVRNCDDCDFSSAEPDTIVCPDCRGSVA